MKKTLAFGDFFLIFCLVTVASILANKTWQLDIENGVAPSNEVK